MRAEEMIFLGMQRQPKTVAELLKDDPITKEKDTTHFRK
jgi:IQ and AAA domain-containing protein